MLAGDLYAVVRRFLDADLSWRLGVRTVVAGLLLAGVVRWWRWATRGIAESADDVEAGASTGAPVMAILLTAIVAPAALAYVAATLEAAVTDGIHLVGFATTVASALGHSWVGSVYGTTVGLTLIGLSAFTARRHPCVLPAWLGVAGSVLLVLTQWNTWLDSPAWGAFDTADVARAAVIFVTLELASAGVRWRRQGRPPTPDWIATALTALILIAFVLHGGFVNDPFAPILGFTGVGLVFFGVIWGFVTSGGHAAATDLAGLGRTTILIAYAVLTTTLVAWGSITGSDIAGSASGTFADAGSNILGTTLLTCFLAVWLDRLTNPAELTNPADVTDPAEVSQSSRPRPQGGYRLGHPVRP